MLELAKTAENPPVFADETLHAIIVEKQPVDSIATDVKFTRRYFIGTSKREQEHREEDTFALGMANWAKRINAMVQVSELFVPFEKDAVQRKSIATETIASLKNAAELAQKFSELARKYDFHFYNSSVNVQFNFDMATFTEYMRTECMKLLEATDSIIRQQRTDTEIAFKKGNCTVNRVGYATMLDSLYSWEAMHGVFVADVLTDPRTVKYAKWAATFMDVQLLNELQPDMDEHTVAKVMLINYIYNSALFNDIRAGLLKISDYSVASPQILTISMEQLNTYEDSVLLFIAQFAGEYHQLIK